MLNNQVYRHRIKKSDLDYFFTDTHLFNSFLKSQQKGLAWRVKKFTSVKIFQQISIRLSTLKDS